MKMYKDQKGVTLLELIVGLVLFGIIAAGFTTALVPSLQNMIERSQQPEDWLHEARSCAESIIRDCEEGDICNDDRELEENQCDSISCNSIDIETDIKTEDDNSFCQIKIKSPDNMENKDIVLHLRQDEDNND